MIVSKDIISTKFSLCRSCLSQYPATFIYELRQLDTMEEKTKHLGYLSTGYITMIDSFHRKFNVFAVDKELARIRENDTKQYIQFLKLKYA